MDQLANMRKAIGYTQRDMAKEFGISVQAYYRKEKGYTPFTDEEKVIFRDLVKSMFPFVTIDSLFFSENAKKYKVGNFLGQDQIEGDGDERGK